MKSLHVTRKKTRPSLPLLLIAGLLFWCGVAVSLSFGFNMPDDVIFWLTQVFFILSLLGCCICLLVRKGWSFYVLALVLSVLCACVFISTLILQRATETSLLSGTFTFQLEEDVRHTQYAHTVFANTTLKNGQNVLVRLSVPEDTNLSFGMAIVAQATLRLPSDASMSLCNMHGAAFVATLHEYDKVEQSSPLSMIGVLRTYLKEVLIPPSLRETFNEGACLVQAILFGDRSDLLASDVYDEMQKAGLAHLVAVSGAHLVIVSSCIAFCLQKLPLPRTSKLMVQIGAIVIYLMLVGLPLSCLRAAIMAILGLLALFAKRRSSALSALGVALIIFIASDPTCAVSLSFSLSCLATLGILIFVPLLKPWFTSLWSLFTKRRMPDTLVGPLSMTLAATLLTCPLSITTFAQFPLIAPLSNIVATPLLTLICCMGVLGSLVSWIPGIGACFGFCTVILAEILKQAVQILNVIPYSCIPCDGDAFVVSVIVFLVCVFLWVVWPKPKAINVGVVALSAVMSCVIAMQVFVFRPAPSITMLDVGQGDAIVIRSAYHQVLIDTGNQATRLKKALARNNLTHFDAVFITHADDDHFGSLSELGEMSNIDAVVLAKDMPTVHDDSSEKLLNESYRAANQVLFVSKGDRISFDEFNFEVLSPQTFSDEGGNADSICLYVTYDADNDGVIEWSCLLTGDAEKEVIEQILKERPSLTSDVLKVAHHGSKGALTREVLDKLNPQIALISVGEHNRYGHPHRDTLDLLGAKGVLIGRTDQQGDVVVTLSKDALTLDTQR